MLDDKDRRQVRREVDAYLLAWIFPISMALGFGAGYGLDKLFHTWPYLTFIFTGFGIAAAFVQLFRIGGKNGT